MLKLKGPLGVVSLVEGSVEFLQVILNPNWVEKSQQVAKASMAMNHWMSLRNPRGSFKGSALKSMVRLLSEIIDCLNCDSTAVSVQVSMQLTVSLFSVNLITSHSTPH